MRRRSQGKRVRGPFEVIGPEPEGQLYRHGAGDPVAGEGEADDGDPVVLAAGGEEEGLVEDAEEGDEDGGREEVL
jgi:hypothetical protein